MNFNKKLAVAVSSAVLLMAGQVALADSATDIVDALVSKGVLTEEEGKLITKGHTSKTSVTPIVKEKDGAFTLESANGRNSLGSAWGRHSGRCPQPKQKADCSRKFRGPAITTEDSLHIHFYLFCPSPSCHCHAHIRAGFFRSRQLQQLRPQLLREVQKCLLEHSGLVALHPLLPDGGCSNFIPICDDRRAVGHVGCARAGQPDVPQHSVAVCCDG